MTFQPTGNMVAQDAGARLAWRITAVIIILFWIGQFSILTVSRIIYGAGDDVRYLLPRCLVTLAGVALSFVIAGLHQRTRRRSLSARLLLAIAMALGGAMIHALINYATFYIVMPQEQHWKPLLMEGYAMAVLQWFWSYAALSSLMLVVTYSAELHEHERRVAQLQREAHAAHLRALRYQLNPHFMFNTLNSIAALVSSHEVGLAERMVENLADFLRAGLALDPNEDIPLDREIELQSLYLQIEAVRFPDRLVVDIDIPEEIRGALVPSLIVQPLVENAVRHAVAVSTTPVRLTIAARRADGRLNIRVHNTVGSAMTEAGSRRGTGVGIANVAERLLKRYGDDCGFAAGRQPDGGFEVRFAIPLDEAY